MSSPFAFFSRLFQVKMVFGAMETTRFAKQKKLRKIFPLMVIVARITTAIQTQRLIIWNGFYTL